MASIWSYIEIKVALLLTVIAAIIYLYFKYCFNYFKHRKISYLKPSFPLGDIKFSFYRKYGQDLQIIYNTFKKQGAAYGGFYILTKPVIIPVDPEIVRQILSQDFKYFSYRGFYYNEEKEFLSTHLVTLEVQEWKNLRGKFTPAFSPMKLKHMVDIMIEKTDVLQEKLQDFASTAKSFEPKDLCIRISTDMFCSVAFGIDCNSLTDPNAEFPKYAKMLVVNNLYHATKLIIAIALPKLFEKLNLNTVKTEFQEFFIKTITEVVEHREKYSVERPDLMDLLIKLKNNVNIDDKNLDQKSNDGITMKQLIAQSFVFFLGGVDTSAIAMNYCLFEMTQHQNLQNNLREEIWSVLEKHGNKLTYEAIMEMQLLDKVIADTSKVSSSCSFLNRECVEDYSIPGTESVIEKGTSVMVSVLGLHHDPEFYPDPDKFDPERFSDEEKAKRHPYAYLPFGEGPRNCLGMRLGLLQAKIGMIYLLKNYKYALNSKTKLPLEFKTELVLLATNGDIWIDVNKI